MSELSLKSKIIINKNIQSKISQLKDSSMILYSQNGILKINKNLSSYKLNSISKYNNFFNFEKEEEIPNNIRKILQIKNKIIVCDNNLYIYDINPKNDNPKKYPYDLSLLDIVELKNGKLLGITLKNLFLIDIEKILSELLTNKFKKHHEKIFKFPKEWHIKPTLKKSEEFVNGYLLQNNNLLVHFNSREIEQHGGCIMKKYKRFFNNKIYIVNIDNLKLIKNFEEFEGETFIFISNLYIIIGYKNNISLFNIKDYELKKSFDIKHNTISMILYSENIILSIDKTNWKGKDIFAFDISDINDIKYYIIETTFIKDCYGSLYKLKNGNILFVSFEKIYILAIYKNIHLLAFKSLRDYINNKKFRYNE